MYRALVIIIAIGGFSLYFFDFAGAAFFRSTLLPSVAIAALLALAAWLFVWLQLKGASQNIESGTGDSHAALGDGPGGDAG